MIHQLSGFWLYNENDDTRIDTRYCSGRVRAVGCPSTDGDLRPADRDSYGYVYV